MAPHAPIPRAAITAVVLAGGRGERMGGADKGLLPLGDAPLIAHVLARLARQVDSIVISANRNRERYAAFGYPITVDTIGGFAGPLAGVHAAILDATSRYIVTVPCDAPHFPADLVARLATSLGAMPDAHAAIARTAGRVQPVFALYDRLAVLASLEAYLHAGQRRADAWQATLARTVVDFDDSAAFRNLNTPEELAAAAP